MSGIGAIHRCVCVSRGGRKRAIKYGSAAGKGRTSFSPCSTRYVTSRYVNLHFRSLCLVRVSKSRWQQGYGHQLEQTKQRSFVSLTSQARRGKESRNPREPLIYFAAPRRHHFLGTPNEIFHESNRSTRIRVSDRSCPVGIKESTATSSSFFPSLIHRG